MNSENQNDLLGMPIAVKRTNSKPEAAALVEVLQALRAHPAVAWCERQNSGAARIGNRFIRFGFAGCPDVLGQLRDGRMLGVEVKALKGKLRPEQSIVLERINGAGGVAFMARNCLDVFNKLGAICKNQSLKYCKQGEQNEQSTSPWAKETGQAATHRFGVRARTR